MVDFASYAINSRFRKSRPAGRKLYFRITNLKSQEAGDAVEAKRRKTTHQESGQFEKAAPVVGRGGLSTLPRGFRGLRDPSSQFGHRQGDDEEEKLSPAARPARCCGAAHATRVWLHRTSKIRMRFAQGSWRQDADANRRCLRALRMIASGVAVFAAWVKARAVTSALFFAALMATAQTARELV